MLINTSDNSVIGAHIAHHNSADVPSILALAIKHSIKAVELAEFLRPYPRPTARI